MEEKRSSYAVIPSYIMDDEKLHDGAKMLYARISMYSQEGRCWASNKHLSEKHGVDVRTIQRWLKELSDEGYIEIEIEIGGFQTKRNIWITNDFKKSYTKRQPCHPHPTQMSPTPDANVTLINTSDINIKEDIKPPPTSSKNSVIPDISKNGGGGEKSSFSLIYKNTKGEAKKVLESEIYSHFVRLPYETHEIQQAIEEVKQSNDFIGNIFKYLEAICHRIHNSQPKTQAAKQKRECNVPDTSHLPKVNFGDVMKQRHGIDLTKKGNQ